ncbi:hypothetical protein [Streptomyces sp. NBC_01180]|uniref:hypothetical protein n=1 Tax=Streptomyces sp. NBC_01180 TaxID=2903763 RepID=UPI00386FF2EA|nr:hypothetical protein OG708_08960 [Streptomyces sp. NBC_01180]
MRGIYHTVSGHTIRVTHLADRMVELVTMNGEGAAISSVRMTQADAMALFYAAGRNQA